MNKKHIGLTIGPIYKTIKRAKATRELWAASYLFSYLMREIIFELQSETGKKFEPIAPYLGDEAKKQIATSSAGLVPDRLFMPVDEGDLQEVQNQIDAAVTKIAQKVGNALSIKADTVEKFIIDYFKIYTVETDINDNPLFELNDYLDTLELQDKFTTDELESDVLSILFEKMETVKERKRITNEVFNVPVGKLPSLVEISTRSLAKTDLKLYKETLTNWENAVEEYRWKSKSDKVSKKQLAKIEHKESDFIINLKKAFPKDFKTYHKYIAIVQADGDSIGSTIGEIGMDGERTKDFSTKLFNFAYEAVEKIKAFDGLPVYAGGDDLLFFAPIISNDVLDDNGQVVGKTLFHLLEQLDEIFQKEFKEENPPTLSFGVSISYYKFPMNEAIQASYDLLFHKAKFHKSEKAKEEPDKNAVAVKVQKHSGQFFEHTFSMINNKSSSNALFKIFQDLLQGLDVEGTTINSMIYNLDRNRFVLHTIGNEEVRVANFLKNSFDEDIHKKVGTFMKQIENLIVNAYKLYGKPTQEQIDNKEDKALQTVYSILRTINFLKRKDNDNE